MKEALRHLRSVVKCTGNNMTQDDCFYTKHHGAMVLQAGRTQKFKNSCAEKE